jgi:hypothetical protein
VIRISRQSFLAVRDGADKIFSHETDRGALVPTFREVRSNVDDARKFGFRFIELALLHRVYSNAKNPLCFSISRAAPSSPQHRLSSSRQRGVVAFECFEEFSFSLRKHDLEYL